MFTTPHRRAVSAAIAVTVLWSSSWILIRYGLDDEGLGAISFAGLRYSTAAIALIGYVASNPTRRRAVGSLTGSDWKLLIVLGVVFFAVTQGAQFVAIDHQPAATSSVVLSMTPMMIALIGGPLIGERPVARQYLGAGFVAVGAFLFGAGELGATLIGMVAAVVNLIANTGSSLLGRTVNRLQHIPPVVVTVASMTTGAAVLVATGFAVEGLPTLTGRAVLIIGWLAIVNTALAFTLWNYSLRNLSAVESSSINNLMLVQIALLAWIFLDEAPGLLGLAGIVVVTAGIRLTSRPGARRGQTPS